MNRVLKYLKGTKRLGILYSADRSNVQIDAYANANFAAEKTRWSTTGHIVQMYGFPVAWCSRLQRCRAEVMSEAELKLVCTGAHNILFLMYLTDELLYPVEQPITTYEGNVGALRHYHLSASWGRIRHLELLSFQSTRICSEPYSSY